MAEGSIAESRGSAETLPSSAVRCRLSALLLVLSTAILLAASFTQ